MGIRAAHLLALSAFGIAQPAFDLLSRNSDFFVVEQFQAVDVVLYGLAVLLVPPAIVFALELAAGLVSSRLVAIAHPLFVAMFVALVVGRGLHTVPTLVKVVVGLVFACLYTFWRPVQSFVSVSALASLVFLGLFLANAPIAKLSVTDAPAAAISAAGPRPPVVLVIFDEFPESSLMSTRGQIDARSYPNFGALARSATWYRDATTVDDHTTWAVPAILTGQLPRHDQLPLLADHKKNVFTLLGGTYHIDAFQAVTRMCPARLCSNAHEPLRRRLHRLASYVETTIVHGLPRTDVRPWRNPHPQEARFVASLHASDAPHLYVLHVLLPHSPWRYLPSGRAYEGFVQPRGLFADVWTGDTRVVDRRYREYLLQLAYVDRILGQIMRRLHTTGLWERSLFVVTADHGMSIRAGGHFRTVDTSNVGDIAPVPLFVKVPGERTGHVDDRQARTIDIVPTIADELGIEVPWKLDGRSLLEPGRPYPSRVVVASHTGATVTSPWRRVKAERDEMIARRARLAHGLTQLARRLLPRG
jgi:hypothetical protein